MCYKCSACGEVVKDRSPLLRHTEYKEGTKQIKTEYPVCQRCHYLLGLGYSLTGLRKKWEQEKRQEEGVRIGPGVISVAGAPVGSFVDIRLVPRKKKKRKGQEREVQTE